MNWSNASVRTKTRVPGTTHYRAPQLATTRSRTSAPLTVRSLTSHQQTATQQTIQESDPNALDPITSKYISNLQGQIHLLELESKLLKERVSAQNANDVDLDGIDANEVNPKIRALRREYQLLEERCKAEKEVCFVFMIATNSQYTKLSTIFNVN